MGVDLSYLHTERITERPSAFHTFADEAERIYVSDLQYEFSIGHGDYRNPSLELICADGSPTPEFVFESYSVVNGKPELNGLPYTYCEDDTEAGTLEVVLREKVSDIRVKLQYTVFENYDVITRSICLINDGESTHTVKRISSMRVDMPGQNYKILYLPGDWARERQLRTQPVGEYIFSVDSKRGMSSHARNPFIALLRDNANENCGEVFGFSLVYSGNFSAYVEGLPSGDASVCMGIGSSNFSWHLLPGESFQTPEVCMVYSADGLNCMSQKYHKIYRERLCRGYWRDKIRPIVINNWEGTMFDFNEEKLLRIAAAGVKAGAEVFVLDDGWFGNRENEKSSLGDWQVNLSKLPSGLNGLSEKINALGLGFGIWLEPEMISPASKLYEAHPDWCLNAPNRTRTLNRWQYILDLAKEEVREYVFKAVSDVLESASISYVKWDCNRNITELGDTEQSHRYILGLYEILERLHIRFPKVLFEGCSGGGGRFDPGMLYYMPQIWTSDNTAPVPRMGIQTGTSIVYPAVCMTAHIGENAIKNNELDLSAHVAMSGNFGLEMDISNCTEQEIDHIRKYVHRYKELRATIQFGKMFRLEHDELMGYYAFEFLDNERCIVISYQSKSGLNGCKHRIYPKGLEPQGKYMLGEINFSGAELMHVGINTERTVALGYQLFELIKR